MHLHHLAFRTHQLAPLVAFYRDLLQLPQGRAQPGYSQWFHLGPTVLMVEQAEAHEPAIPAKTMELALSIPVTPAAQAALEARLTAANTPIEFRTAATIYFRDPDGRRLGASTAQLSAPPPK
jgi:catechol 2,3-dioxygenase-like lactoylglutathione lyase family enzyme